MERPYKKLDITSWYWWFYWFILTPIATVMLVWWSITARIKK